MAPQTQRGTIRPTAVTEQRQMGVALTILSTVVFVMGLAILPSSAATVVVLVVVAIGFVMGLHQLCTANGKRQHQRHEVVGPARVTNMNTRGDGTRVITLLGFNRLGQEIVERVIVDERTYCNIDDTLKSTNTTSYTLRAE